VSVLKSNLLLLLAAAIWGFAFVAQRVGMEYVGPFTFTGVRFLLGALSLIPVMLYFRTGSPVTGSGLKSAVLPGLWCGLVLFGGVTCQQIGLMYTTAGKAAFITGLYLVLVPMAGIFLGHLVGRETWLGCLLAVTGLYFLCVHESVAINYGDLLELAGTFFWTVHILFIAHFSRRVNVLQLSLMQFLVCSLLSLVTAVITENIYAESILACAVPILYGGLCSVGIAYTFQAVGQKYAPPAHAAIIMSLEALFAAIGGFLLINERMGILEIMGCVLMLTGMLVSQLGRPGKEPDAVKP
jgi:drug/metabolite transporter (DMT)-like permease